MLSSGKVHPTISVTDLDRAAEFYGGTLELKTDGEITEDHIRYNAGDSTYIIVYKRTDPPKAENTVASFEVDDVEGTVEWLKGKGVSFEEYDFPGFKTVNGIATLGDIKGAWFKDPDGNILAVANG